MTPSPTTLNRVPDPEVPARATRRHYTAHYKNQILAEYDFLDAAGRGALLRRHGLYTSHITNWRKVRTKGGLAALGATPGRLAADPREQEIARLQHDNTRLQGQLATAQRVIEVQGKLSALLDQLATSSVPTPTSSGELTS
jgi:transposase